VGPWVAMQEHDRGSSTPDPGTYEGLPDVDTLKREPFKHDSGSPLSSIAPYL
jgi:hypothetical protein